MKVLLDPRDTLFFPTLDDHEEIVDRQRYVVRRRLIEVKLAMSGEGR